MGPYAGAMRCSARACYDFCGKIERAFFMATGAEKKIVRTLALGALTGLLYAGLFLAEDPILRVAALGGWNVLVPVAIAFTFSAVHGAFTGHFWDLLGVKARK